MAPTKKRMGQKDSKTKAPGKYVHNAKKNIKKNRLMKSRLGYPKNSRYITSETVDLDVPIETLKTKGFCVLGTIHVAFSKWTMIFERIELPVPKSKTVFPEEAQEQQDVDANEQNDMGQMQAVVEQIAENYSRKKKETAKKIPLKQYSRFKVQTRDTKMPKVPVCHYALRIRCDDAYDEEVDSISSSNDWTVLAKIRALVRAPINVHESESPSETTSTSHKAKQSSSTSTPNKSTSSQKKQAKSSSTGSKKRAADKKGSESDVNDEDNKIKKRRIEKEKARRMKMQKVSTNKFVMLFTGQGREYVVRRFKKKQIDRIMRRSGYSKNFDIAVQIIIFDCRPRHFPIYDFERGPVVFVRRRGEQWMPSSPEAVIFTVGMNDKKVYMDKSVAKMHSIKFRQAIEEAEKEGQIPQINIEPDITQSVFKAALEFINGGVLKVDNIPDLLELAHRYEITYIKSVCAQKLATMKRKKFPLKKKLALAYKYELDPLKIHFLRKMNSRGIIRKILKEEAQYPTDFISILKRKLAFCKEAKAKKDELEKRKLQETSMEMESSASQTGESSKSKKEEK